jgi:hypothetical protein
MSWSSTNSSNYSGGYIPFSTTIYFTDLNFDNPNDIFDYRNFANKFSKEMEEKGWSFNVYYQNKRITATAADGVFTSQYGTTKIIDNKIKSIGYTYNLQPALWGPDSGIVCPCQLHLEIFIGDEINLENI